MSNSAEQDSALIQRRTALVSLAAAALLVALKLGAGLVTASLGLVSTGIESSGDLIAASVIFFAVRLGRRPADREHPYGHRRAENLGGLAEGVILLGGGLVVAVVAIAHLINAAAAPDIRAYQFAVIAIALVVDLSRTLVSLRAASRFDSAALRASASHFAADMVGSLIVLVGLLLVREGFAQGDSIAALAVAGIVCATAARLIAENANVLMDRTPREARRVAERAIARLGVDVELSRLRLRESSGRYFADVVVTVPPAQAVVEGHRAADMVEAAVHGALPGSDVVVHVEPRDRGIDLRERVLAIALAEPLVIEAHDITIFQQGRSRSVSLHLKFPADLELRAAAEVAGRVERAIGAEAGVVAVQTHLEPIEETLSARLPDDRADRRVRLEIDGLVRRRTGAGAQRIKLFSTDAGSVVFLTLGLRSGESLSEAHTLAGELEEELRQQIPGIAEVVIHTGP